MSKARMMGAFAKYTPNNRADARFNRKGYDRTKQKADSATPRAERRQQKEKRQAYDV